MEQSFGRNFRRCACEPKASIIHAFMLWIEINAAEPQGGGFAQRLDRKSLALVPLPGKRHHVLAPKRARHRLECALLLGKLEIHAAPLLPEAVAPRYHGRGVEWAKARNAPCLRLFSYI